MTKNLNFFFNGIRIVLLIITLSCSGKKNVSPIKGAINNGDFETVSEKLTGWILQARHSEKDLPNQATGEPVANIVKEAYTGEHSLHVFWDIPDTDSWNSLWVLTNTALYPVKPGDIFTVTGWMKGTSGFHCGKL